MRTRIAEPIGEQIRASAGRYPVVLATAISDRSANDRESNPPDRRAGELVRLGATVRRLARKHFRIDNGSVGALLDRMEKRFFSAARERRVLWAFLYIGSLVVLALSVAGGNRACIGIGAAMVLVTFARLVLL